MSDVIHNPHTIYPQPPSPNQISGSPSSFEQKPNNKTPLIIALIVVLLLMVFISGYFAFGRSVAKPVSPEIVEKNLPAGANR